MLPDVPSGGSHWKKFIIYSHLIVYVASVLLNGAQIISILRNRVRKHKKKPDLVLLNVAG